jgi:hypothetical protein
MRHSPKLALAVWCVLMVAGVANLVAWIAGTFP